MQGILKSPEGLNLFFIDEAAAMFTPIVKRT